MKLSKKRVVAASLLAVSVAGAAGMDCQAEAADLAKNQLQTNQANQPALPPAGYVPELP